MAGTSAEISNLLLNNGVLAANQPAQAQPTGISSHKRCYSYVDPLLDLHKSKTKKKYDLNPPPHCTVVDYTEYYIPVKNNEYLGL